MLLSGSEPEGKERQVAAFDYQRETLAAERRDLDKETEALDARRSKQGDYCKKYNAELAEYKAALTKNEKFGDSYIVLFGDKIYAGDMVVGRDNDRNWKRARERSDRFRDE